MSGHTDTVLFGPVVSSEAYSWYNMDSIQSVDPKVSVVILFCLVVARVLGLFV